MLRIDAHVHGDPDEFTGDPKGYVEECRGLGVEAVVHIADLEQCVKAVEKFGGDFVIPVVRIAMNAGTVREIEASARAGAKGIKFIRPEAPYANPRYWPLYDKVLELGLAAVFHTGYLGDKGSDRDRPVRMEDMRPAQIETISRRFPDLRIVMAHFGNPWWEEAWKVCHTKKNVYADLSGGTALLRSTAMWAETFAPDGKLLGQTVRKLMFASDVSYFCEGPPEVAPYFEFYDRVFDRIGLDEAQREWTNRGAARMLFCPEA